MTTNEKFAYKPRQSLNQVESETSVSARGINTTDDEEIKQQSDSKLQPFLIQSNNDFSNAKNKSNNCLDMFFNNKKNELYGCKLN